MVDGILLAGTGKNKKLVRDIQVSGIPVTQVIRIQDDTLSSVTVDYVKCGYEAVTYLYGRGSRHPGLITGSLKLSPYKFRYQGYKKALEELVLQEITSEARGFTNSLEYGYQATLEMPARIIGRKAAQLVLEQIEAKDKASIPIQHVVYDSALIEREST